MAPIISRQSWFIKYKLYHIPFWLLYSYLLWALEIGSLYEAAGEYFFSVFRNQVFLLCALSSVRRLFQPPYFPSPRFLQKGRYGWYLLFLAFTIIASSFLIIPGYYASAAGWRAVFR